MASEFESSIKGSHVVVTSCSGSATVTCSSHAARRLLLPEGTLRDVMTDNQARATSSVEASKKFRPETNQPVGERLFEGEFMKRLPD